MFNKLKKIEKILHRHAIQPLESYGSHLSASDKHEIGSGPSLSATAVLVPNF